MAGRLRFTVAQPIAIVGWYISSIFLVSLTASAAGPLKFSSDADLVWSPSFYYAVWAAIQYFVVASLLVVTFWGAYHGHYEKDVILTTSQRTLMLQMILFLLYLLVGALIFSAIEGWDYFNALYWADVTLFTVGFGDFYPTTTLGQALLIPYALFGIISLGLMIGAIRSLVLTGGRQRMSARVVERKRRKIVRKFTEQSDDHSLQTVETAEEDPSTVTPVTTTFETPGWRETEFDLARRIQHEANRRWRWYALAISMTTWLVLWCVSAKVFRDFEESQQNWTYFDAFYFCFISLTTIGYGNLTPLSNGGKSFFVFWSLLALPTMTILISDAEVTVVRAIRDATNHLGSITILPGERGFRRDIKETLNLLSCGLLFHKEAREARPVSDGQSWRCRTPRGVSQSSGASAREKIPTASQEVDEDPRDTRTPKTSEGSISKNEITASDRQRLASTSEIAGQAECQGASTAQNGNIPGDIPMDRPQLCVALIEEIRRAALELEMNQPRKYTFQEWAWYVKLIGHDGSRTTHAEGEQSLSHSQSCDACDRHEEADGRSNLQHKLQWSWLGAKSPLMGSQGETKWILDNLIQKLSYELKEAAELANKATREGGS